MSNCWFLFFPGPANRPSFDVLTNVFSEAVGNKPATTKKDHSQDLTTEESTELQRLKKQLQEQKEALQT